MVIDKVHGLHSTGISMSERFAMIAETAPVFQPRNRQTAPGTLYQNGRNRQQFGQYRRLEWQQKRHELRQRLGLQRFGSENNLPALRRSGSFGNLSQTSRQGFRNKANWQGSSGNLSRTSSFRTFSQATWKSRLMRRGYQRRGVGKRGSVGRNRGFRQGRMGSNGQRRNFQQGNQGGRGRGGRGRGRGRGWGRGRGGNRNLTSKPVPTREELDKELDQYMASSKSALDRELEAYMSTAVMELE